MLYQMAHDFEALYEFNIGRLHIGPMVEIGIEEVSLYDMGGVILITNYLRSLKQTLIVEKTINNNYFNNT
jgi:hypothetical protein